MSKIPSYVLLNSMLVDENNQLRSLEMDEKATKAYFMEYVNKNTQFFHDVEEKLDFLFEEGYYEQKFFSSYTMEDIKSIYAMAYKQKFRFKSFMAAQKFYESYALKDFSNTLILERFEDRMAVLALVLAKGNFEVAKRLIKQLIRQNGTPATPVLLNTGLKAGGAQVSCFLLAVNDSLEDIMVAITHAAQLSKLGGGVSLNFNEIRCRGEKIKGRANASSGIMPFAKIADQTARATNQLGQRDGAFAIYLNIFHGDSVELLGSKSVNADIDSRLVSISTGLVIPDKFYELARKNKMVNLFKPYEVRALTGKTFTEVCAEMDMYYEELSAHPEVISQTLPARELLEMIMISLGESGYPFVMNIDNVNKANALADKVHFSNLCTEILQPTILSSYGKYGRGEDVIGMDISCNLASLNVLNVMKNKDLKEAVFAFMTMMNAVAEDTDIDYVSGVAKANKLNRSVGLGAMNLHGYLASQYIAYGSDEAIEFVDVFFAAVNFYSLKVSMEKAKETGSPFFKFEQSKYADGSYFEKHGEVLPASPKVTQLFEGVELPTQADWDQLKVDVMTYGLYNSNRLAIAPTGSVSYANNATPSVTCVKKLVEERTYGKSKTYFPMPGADQFGFMYETAYEADKYKLINMIATMQKHVDQGISFELNIPSTMTSRELSKLYLYAHHVGLKTIYYVRTKQMKKGAESETNIVECESCAI